ncbi:DUF2461 domain-containing protein [Marinoscillum sp. MHG1-6]|uniref:DUF2461 domain-containing protein n=1 Tax=Marinoscillum sp. MHG1-6 TaxID=2959627 RepID=UPI002157691F|nr:DUF2461 domain-containing protein [Marinoscillum sp. MHG1-6]
MKKTLDFLTQLAQNNEREWFNAHKESYLEADKEVKSFSVEVFNLLSTHDHLEPTGTKVFRIYKDVRFSKDKTPYKTNRSGSFKRATALLRGGYYWSIEPGNSFVAGGFFGPNSEDLLHIRKQISQEPERLYSIIQSESFIKYFGALVGKKLKSAPRGFEKDDPAIDLLKHKQFIVKHPFSDQEVVAPDFPEKVMAVYLSLRPFFDYMSEILTTDLNGVPLH